MAFGTPTTPPSPLRGLSRPRRPADARVVVKEGGSGTNQKVLNLKALAEESRYPLLAFSDSDMVVDKDYLRRIVAEFRSGDKTGIVTSLYKISNPASVGSALESLSHRPRLHPLGARGEAPGRGDFRPRRLHPRLERGAPGRSGASTPSRSISRTITNWGSGCGNRATKTSSAAT